MNSSDNIESKHEEQSQGQAFVGGQLVELVKGIKVDFAQPMEHLNKEGVRAFRALGSDGYPSNLVALVCGRDYSPRRFAGTKYEKINNGHLLKMWTSGVIRVPQDKAESFCFVFDDVGTPLVPSLEYDKAHALSVKTEAVLQNMVIPISAVLKDLYNKDLIHGEIWLGNMYSQTGKATERIVLGECLSAPSSFLLPSLYHTAERAIADPMGRGIGTRADDMYAFGVSLAVALRGSDPLGGATKEQIIERKLDKGSYATLIGAERFSGPMLELLRGLLHDDPEQRWTLDDVEEWIDGRRLSPKQAIKRVKANRPIIFNDVKYTRPELLAKDLIKNPPAALRLVENKDLIQWLDRAIEDKTLKNAVEDTMKEVSSLSGGSDYVHQLIVYISTALFNEIPVRYKDLSFNPTAFGKMMSAALMKEADIKNYTEILRHSFMMRVIREKKSIIEGSSLVAKFDSCRNFIAQTFLGGGIERCLYLMDPESHCLSPMLKEYYVISSGGVMRALEQVCEKSSPKSLIDRHIAAFLSVKDKKNIDAYFGEIRASDPHIAKLGQLRVLATIQKRLGLEPFPAIAEWMSNNTEEVYAKLKDKKAIDNLKKKVAKIKKTGDLSSLVHLYDNPALYQADMDGFENARRIYKGLNKEKIELETRLQNKKDYGQHTGRQIASTVSVIIAMVMMVLISYFILFLG